MASISKGQTSKRQTSEPQKKSGSKSSLAQEPQSIPSFSLSQRTQTGLGKGDLERRGIKLRRRVSALMKSKGMLQEDY